MLMTSGRFALPRSAICAALAILLSLLAGNAGHAQGGIAAALGEAPQGFGRAATGGCTDKSCTCVVTTTKDESATVAGSLRSCVETPEPKWVVFGVRGTIKLERPLRVASNKLIDGRKQKPDDGPVTLAGTARFLVYLEGVQNIVLSDLYFRTDRSAADNPAASPACKNPKHPADTVDCGQPVAIHGAVKNVWINHSDFDHCGAKCITIWTAPLHGIAATGKVAGADLITISNSVFRNSFYGVLVGAAAGLSRENIPEEMRVTLYGNVYYNVKRRSPRAASFAKVHVFNNVMKFWGEEGGCRRRNDDWAASAIGEAQLLLENNVMVARADGCKLAVQIGEKPKSAERRGSGFVRAGGNRAENGAMLADNQPDKVFNPRDKGNAAYAYDYTLRPLEGLAESVTRNAGVRDFPKDKFGG
jgi:pectate lyase